MGRERSRHGALTAPGRQGSPPLLSVACLIYGSHADVRGDGRCSSGPALRDFGGRRESALHGAGSHGYGKFKIQQGRLRGSLGLLPACNGQRGFSCSLQGPLQVFRIRAYPP